ncbi:hypothetical protein QVD17_24071 [Tagetes erecta]|uniref:Uncharacterized protein n=1 Tax=Tagetes erecta TaxID=13708 RepID=A0AAD8KJS2_TARER|nr:hypothetical protein QVD17_24071 [Tagetes erecta]
MLNESNNNNLRSDSHIQIIKCETKKNKFCHIVTFLEIHSKFSTQQSTLLAFTQHFLIFHNPPPFISTHNTSNSSTKHSIQ